MTHGTAGKRVYMVIGKRLYKINPGRQQPCWGFLFYTNLTQPTGALDSETGVIVLELLQKLCKEEKRTVILVTHNADIAKCADKVIRMKNGKIREIYRNEKPLSVKEVEW